MNGKSANDKSDCVMEPDEFRSLLEEAAMPEVVMPLVCACAGPDGRIMWKGTAHLPREADVTAHLIERRAEPAWRHAVAASIGLASISDALGRYLARPAMEQPAPARDPADFIVAAAAEALGAESLANAWFRGVPEAIERLQHFLTLAEHD